MELVIEHRIDFGEQLNPKKCLICLPGRGGTGTELAIRYQQVLNEEWLIVGLTPADRSWYPPPGGPKNQKAAIAGIPYAKDAVNSIVSDVACRHKLDITKIAIAGFSAGGVVAVQLGETGNFGGVICHSGAILDPDALRTCLNSRTAYLLTHSEDDNVFTWSERYLPMRDALRAQRYNVKCAERKSEGHCVTYADLAAAVKVLANV